MKDIIIDHRKNMWIAKYYCVREWHMALDPYVNSTYDGIVQLHDFF